MKHFGPWKTVALPLLALGVLLAACGNGPEAETGSSQRPDRAASEVRPAAADFAVSTGPGTAFSLSGHTGDVVILYFSFPG